MRKKNQLDHKLGNRGYLGKRKVWAKEDESAQKAGRAGPFSYLKAGRGKDFVKASAKYNLLTGQLIFKSKEVTQVHEKLVSS
jgi:hypothetical protein